MARAVSATEAKNRFGTVLNWVTKDGDDVVVERQGKPLAAIVSIAEYEEFNELRQRRRRQEAVETLRQLRETISARNADMTPEEVEEFADRVSREAVESLIRKGKIRFEP